MGNLKTIEKCYPKTKIQYRITAFFMALLLMLSCFSGGLIELVNLGVIDVNATYAPVFSTLTYKSYSSYTSTTNNADDTNPWIRTDPSTMANYNFTVLSALYGKTYSEAAGVPETKNGNTVANDDVKFNYHNSVSDPTKSNKDCASFVSRCIAYSGVSFVSTKYSSNGNNGWYAFGINTRTAGAAGYPNTGTNSTAWSTVASQGPMLSDDSAPIRAAIIGYYSPKATSKHWLRISVLRSSYSKRAGDILIGSNDASGWTHSMLVVTDGNKGDNFLVVSSNADWQEEDDVLSAYYKLYRPTKYWVITSSSKANTIITKVDGRPGYGYGFDGNNKYSSNSQISYFYYNQTTKRYGYTETVKTPVTTPKITDKSGNILYCSTFIRQHPGTMSYVSSNSSYAYSNVDSMVYYNGWHTDSETIAEFNARMRTIADSMGRSYTDLGNPYEAYAATQLAMWKVDGSSENSAIASVHAWTANNTKLNRYKNASQRVYNAGQLLADYSKANSSSTATISALPTIRTSDTSTLESYETTVNGTKYVVQGPININSKTDDGYEYIDLKNVTLTSSNADVKLTTSATASGIASASTSLNLPTGSSWDVYAVAVKPKTGTEIKSNISISGTTVAAVLTSGAAYTTYTAEYGTNYLQKLFKANGEPKPVSGKFNVELVFENVYGQVSLSKVNRNGDKLANISFGVYEDEACTIPVLDRNNEKHIVVTTNSDGRVIESPDILTNDEGKIYYVKEISMTSDQSKLYSLNPTVYPVKVVKDTVTPINSGNPIINEWLPSTLTLTKLNENGDPLSGITFGVYTTEQCTELVKDVNGKDVVVVTNDSGIATTPQIKVDSNGKRNVYVKEISISDKYETSYVLNKNVYHATLSAGVSDVKITDGEANNGTAIVNEWANGTFDLYKVDDDGKPLEGIIFAAFSNAECTEMIFDVNGLPVLLQTDANGYAKSNEIKVTKNGTKAIYLKEMQMTEEQEKYYEYLKETILFSVVAGKNVTATTDGANVVNDHIVIPVKVTKLDFTDSSPVPGATITIYDESGEEVYSGITGANGETEEVELRVGKYTFKETISPDPSATGGKGYKINENVFEFTVNSDRTISGDTTIKDEPTEVTISKKDVTTAEGVPGAEITIYDKVGTAIRTGVTGEDGTVTFTYLPYGTYTFKETIAPEGYVINETVFTFTIDRDGKVTGDNTVTDKKTEITITKTDLTDGKPVAGAQISIYSIDESVDVEKYIAPVRVSDSDISNNVSDSDVSDNVSSSDISDVVSDSDVVKKYVDASKLISEEALPVFTGYTDGNGQMTALKLPVGKYVFKETLIPNEGNGYQINESAFAFVINEDGTIIGCKEFTDEPTKVTITKTDLTTEETVPGAEITIYDEKGNEVFKDITDENGEVTAFYLPQGEYTFKETVAPNGYLINEATFKFKINDKGQPVGDHNISDKPTEVTITKTDLTTSEPVPGAEITIYDESGKEIFKDITDEDGTVTAFRLPFGNYTFKETLAPDGETGYQINSNTFEFTIKEDGTVNGMVEFTDEPTRVVITKRDMTTSETVPEAEISIYNEENVEVFNGFTDSNGELEAMYLPAGTYTFKEITAPEGYALNETVFTFTINRDGSVTGDDTVTDEPTKVVIQKQDVTTSKGVSGAEITIYDENGEEVYKDITDFEGNITAFRLPVGTYTFKETVAPKGYLINEAVFTFTINEDGTITGDNTVVDERIQGYIQIIKTDSKNKTKKLQDAAFYVFDESGILVDTLITDENGLATTKLLDYGVYTIKEVEAPEGYNIEESAFRVNVTENGKTYVLDVTNDAIVTTGDNSNIGIIVAISLMSVMALVGGSVLIMKRKKI